MDEARQVMSTFSLTLNLTDRRGIQLQGPIYSDDTPDEINKRVDAMQDVLDRQAARCDIQNKEAQIVAHTQNLELLREQHESLVALKKGGKKLTSQQIQMVENFDPSVRRAQEMIDSLRAAIEAARSKYGF